MVKLVGILNVTPDSFSDGGLFDDPSAALAQADRLFSDGAYMIDIGAESTRPGATPLTWQQEWQRLETILPLLIRKYPGRLSLDTYHPETAAKALDLGDVVINDVTGLSDPAMVDLIIARGARCIISHLPGSDIQAAHKGDLLDNAEQVKQDLLAKAGMLLKSGLLKERIILDPGIGFGKTPRLNRDLIRFAELAPEYPVMVGYSRKRFLGQKRMELEPNLDAGRAAIKAGAAYLRVHDVAGHRRLLSL
jgi:dihydropteroate synthase